MAGCTYRYGRIKMQMKAHMPTFPLEMPQEGIRMKIRISALTLRMAQ
jgi:hypothetical protein